MEVEEARAPGDERVMLLRRGDTVTVYGVESLAVQRAAPRDVEAFLADQGSLVALKASLAQRPEFDPRRDAPQVVTQLNIGNTHHCNMACTYCYNELPTQTKKAKEEAGWMTPEVAVAMVDALLAQSGDAPSVSLVFIGGEALLQQQLIIDTLAYAREKAGQQDTAVEAVVYTNGLTLTDEVVAWSNAHEVSLVVSVDGPPRVHDRERLFANGRPTARRVLDNVRRYMETSEDPVRRVRAVSTRPEPLLPLFQYLFDLGFNELHVTPAYDETGITGKNAILDIEAVLAWYEALLCAGVVFSIEPFITIIDRLHERGESPMSWFPCGAGRASLGINPEGGVVPCHHFVRDPQPVLANVRTSLPVFDERLELATPVTEREPCKGCWARHLCGGECYHRAHTAGLGYNGVLTSACDAKRDTIARVVELYARVKARRPEALEDLVNRRLTELSPNWSAYEANDLAPWGG